LTPGNPLDGAWHFYRIFIDEVGRTIGVQFDNGTVQTLAFVGTLLIGAEGPFAFFLSNSMGFVDANATVVLDEVAI